MSKTEKEDFEYFKANNNIKRGKKGEQQLWN